MADFIGPIVSNALAILKARTPDLLAASDVAPFAAFGSEFTGVLLALPALWVMPGKTQFDPEGTLRHQIHDLTIKFALQAPSPEQLATDAMQYMKAIDDALTDSDPGDWDAALADGGQVMRVFVQAHEYGPLYVKGNVMVRLPEMAVQIETQEV